MTGIAKATAAQAAKKKAKKAKKEKKPTGSICRLSEDRKSEICRPSYD